MQPVWLADHQAQLAASREERTLRLHQKIMGLPTTVGVSQSTSGGSSSVGSRG